MTIREFKSRAIKSLTQPESQHNSAVSQTPAFVASSTPSLDVEILLCHFLSLDKTHLLLNQNQEIPADKLELLEKAIKKRQTGLPIAYITNQKEFYGYDFYVNPDVLIPKPDTEVLVEKAVLFLEEKILANPDKILTVCDMCTGSGCIGISVLKSLYQDKKIPLERLPKFTLVDISQKALEVAKKNADTVLGAEKPSYAADSNSGSHNLAAPATTLRQKIRFVQSNLFEMLPYQFDAVLTNPPYVPSSLTDELLKDGRSEPRLALDGDITITGDKSDTDDGLEIIRNLMPQIAEHTTPQGFFLMETGEY
nr:peptide chain release factor N(5)-glutamine methyltransferase [Treponema sp.]